MLQFVYIKKYTMGQKIFTLKEVDAINKYQKDGMFHPLTCCGHNGCKRSDNNEGILHATEEGLICPVHAANIYKRHVMNLLKMGVY